MWNILDRSSYGRDFIRNKYRNTFAETQNKFSNLFRQFFQFSEVSVCCTLTLVTEYGIFKYIWNVGKTISVEMDSVLLNIPNKTLSEYYLLLFLNINLFQKMLKVKIYLFFWFQTKLKLLKQLQSLSKNIHKTFLHYC